MRPEDTSERELPQRAARAVFAAVRVPRRRPGAVSCGLPVTPA
jgi:hypothetical protein